jgi:two-component system phosphate regulon response regulator PhoB
MQLDLSCCARALMLRKMEKIVLIIDDDKDFQTILKVTLNQSGFKVRSLFDGSIADSIVGEPYPDIILLDIDLPLANGVEVGKQLKLNQTTKDIPVIMVSANPYVDELSKEAGAVDFVQKPFTVGTLIQKVKKTLAAVS